MSSFKDVGTISRKATNSFPYSKQFLRALRYPSGKASLDAMKMDIDKLVDGDNKTALINIQEALVFWAIGDGTEINKGYIGEQYTDYWVFRAAEFLDCRTH